MEKFLEGKAPERACKMTGSPWSKWTRIVDKFKRDGR